MAYALGVVLVLLGLWRRIKWPWDSSDPKVQRLNSFGFALFGVLFVGAGAYVIALAARIVP